MGIESSSYPPYVISSDVSGLLERWVPTRGLSLPRNGMLTSLRAELGQTIQGYFQGEVQVVDEADLRQGLSELIGQAGTDVVSLDRAYIEPDDPNVLGFIDLTRGVDEKFEKIGVVPRPNTPSEDAQLDRFRTDDVQPITIVDDVLFEGESVRDIQGKLAARNRPISRVIAGISVAAGRRVLQEELGIEVVSFLEYDEVTDEVCERDFRAGVPMSGRTVFASTGEVYSAPYFEPFGNVQKWASIPEEHSRDFAALCLEQSITLWEAIERASDRRIPSSEVPRQIKGVYDKVSIVDALRRHR